MKTQTLRRVGAILILALAVPAAFGRPAADQSASQTGAVVKAITFAASDKALEVQVAVTGDAVFQAMALANPSRLVVDIAPAARIEAKPLTEVNAFGLATIRTGLFQTMIARVIFDFGGDLPLYDLQKTETGFTVRFTRPEPAVEKPAAPPVETKAAPLAVRTPAKPGAQEAAAEESAETWPEGFFNTTVGVFGGSYSSSSSDFTDVYGKETSLQYGFNLTRTLLYASGFQIDATFELRSFSKTGKSTLSEDESKFSMTPVTIGGRLLYQTKYVMPFVGFGADFYSYDETSALANTNGSANGYHFQAGLYVIFPKIDFLRLKMYYKYTKVTAAADGFDVSLGGPEYGVGLTFGFNVLKPAMLKF
jgi:hypothetical protein